MPKQKRPLYRKDLPSSRAAMDFGAQFAYNSASPQRGQPEIKEMQNGNEESNKSEERLEEVKEARSHQDADPSDFLERQRRRRI